MITAENCINVLEEQVEKISYNSDQKHRVSNCERWEETSRRPNMQIIGIPEREKVIEENFLELKKTLEFAVWEDLPNLQQD